MTTRMDGFFAPQLMPVFSNIIEFKNLENFLKYRFLGLSAIRNFHQQG